MPSHFDFLAQARPASLYKLLEKLSMGDAAIVLTGLPMNLAAQALAFYPEEIQELLKPAMMDARLVSDTMRINTAQNIRAMLEAAKNAKTGSTPHTPKKTPAQPPVPSAPIGPASAAFINTPTPQKHNFSGMDPAASVLTGSTPDEFPDEPKTRSFTPITPKFKSPMTTAKQRTPNEPPAGSPPPSSNNRENPAPMPKPTHPGNQYPGQGINPGRGNPYNPPTTTHDGQPPHAHKNAPNNPQARNAPPPPKKDTGKTAIEQPGSTRNTQKTGSDDARTRNSGELIGMAIADLGRKITNAFTPASGKEVKSTDRDDGDGFKTRDPAAGRSTVPGARKKSPARAAGEDKPVPWVPRQATASPINGPALPGKPPPVSGDPLRSPLAKAGLLDLIGRAQEKFMPKGTAREGAVVKAGSGEGERARPVSGRRSVVKGVGKGGRPEPEEGVVGAERVVVGSTPRVIGPRPRAEELVGGERVRAVEAGARRMDGKAILAAILRSAGAEVRGVVAREEPQLFNELRGRMFYFDDLIYTEEGALARVFTAASAERAALALKFASPRLRERVLRSVSPGRARVLRDCPRRAGMDEVEAAQREVLGVALKLQAAGRILIDPRDPDLMK